MADDDPDYIAATPPDKIHEPSEHFKIGDHLDLWIEFDERGVPTKNAKKKKPTKKEKDDLEQEYLVAKKNYLGYLKDVEVWEQKKVDSEGSLERSDKFRWAFRQVGPEKNAPLEIDELDELLQIMGWAKISLSELSVVKKGAMGIANGETKLELNALRTFVKETLPMLLLEERLMMANVDDLNPEDIYSPRSWRRRLDENGLLVDKKKTRQSVATRGAVSTSKDAPTGSKVPTPSPRSSSRKKPAASSPTAKKK